MKNRQTKKLIFISLIISANMFSQITKLKVEPDKSNVEATIIYDSLSNINSKNAFQHIGQTIYLKENKLAKERGGYLSLLYCNPIFESYNNKLYKSIRPKDGSRYDVNDYEALKGKSFYVNRIIFNNNTEYSSDKKKFLLELIETESKDKVYLLTEEYINRFDDFITLGYFEKLKKLYIGKEYYYLNNRLPGSEEGGLNDIVNGLDRKDIPKGTKLKCVDVSLEDGQYNEIIVIFENPQFGKFFIYLYKLLTGHMKLETLEEHNARIAYNNKLIKKYGQQNSKLIIEGKVRIGFTKQMCIESWGEPEEINKTSGSYGVHEQWVYGNGNYLYFENGVLRTIQN